VGSPGIGILSGFNHMQIEEAGIPEALARFGRRTRYATCIWPMVEKRLEPGRCP